MIFTTCDPFLFSLYLYCISDDFPTPLDYLLLNDSHGLMGDLLVIFPPNKKKKIDQNFENKTFQIYLLLLTKMVSYLKEVKLAQTIIPRTPTARVMQY